MKQAQSKRAALKQRRWLNLVTFTNLPFQHSEIGLIPVRSLKKQLRVWLLMLSKQEPSTQNQILLLIKTERVKLTQCEGPCSNQPYHGPLFVLHSGNIDVRDVCNPCSCDPSLQRGPFGCFLSVTLAVLLLTLICYENKPYPVMLGMCGLLRVPASWFLSISTDVNQMWKGVCDSERIIVFLKFHENRWVYRMEIYYRAGRAVV